MKDKFYFFFSNISCFLALIVRLEEGKSYDEIRCNVTSVTSAKKEWTIQKGGTNVLVEVYFADDPSIKISSNENGEIQTLNITSAKISHAGNYSCGDKHEVEVKVTGKNKLF